MASSRGNTSCAPAAVSWSTTCPATSARGCRRGCGPTAAGGSHFQAERTEVGAAVVVVLVLRALEEADDAVRDRRHDDFPEGLQHVLRDGDLDHVAGRPDAVEGDAVEERRVDQLA